MFRDTGTAIFTKALFTITAKIGNQHKFPSPGEWIKKIHKENLSHYLF